MFFVVYSAFRFSYVGRLLVCMQCGAFRMRVGFVSYAVILFRLLVVSFFSVDECVFSYACVFLFVCRCVFFFLCLHVGFFSYVGGFSVRMQVSLFSYTGGCFVPLYVCVCVFCMQVGCLFRVRVGVFSYAC